MFLWTEKTEFLELISSHLIDLMSSFPNWVQQANPSSLFLSDDYMTLIVHPVINILICKTCLHVCMLMQVSIYWLMAYNSICSE